MPCPPLLSQAEPPSVNAMRTCPPAVSGIVYLYQPFLYRVIRWAEPVHLPFAW